MTNQQHPITPPPELVEQWRDLPEFTDGRRKMIMVTFSREKLLDIATQAARWGADQELEACCDSLQELWAPSDWITSLCAARRPKPPSLKGQAIEALAQVHHAIEQPIAITIRRALEALPE